jgi:hypothetical protein
MAVFDLVGLQLLAAVMAKVRLPLSASPLFLKHTWPERLALWAMPPATLSLFASRELAAMRARTAVLAVD